MLTRAATPRPPSQWFPMSAKMQADIEKAFVRWQNEAQKSPAYEQTSWYKNGESVKELPELNKYLVGSTEDKAYNWQYEMCAMRAAAHTTPATNPNPPAAHSAWHTHGPLRSG